ncbi:phosphotransferase [Gemella sp. 20925_1_85]|uniref:phosphotransferase family protein n=1 Tax=Gemella sp. 20925_1_85 TaxID=3003690 RepID=UPI00352C2828
MKRQLDKLLDTNLQRINHISENNHFIGFSKKLEKQVFVKIFKDPLKYELEYKVLRDKTNLILDLPEYFALVLKYEDYIPLNKESVNDEDIVKIAKLISDFHGGNGCSIENDKEISLKKVLEKNVYRLADRKEYTKIYELYSKFLRNISKLDEEYRKTLVFIHGDFGLRNIMRKDDNLVLIDFERVKYASYYLDFIKYFYQDLDNDKRKIELFLEHYYEHSKEKVLSKELEYCLIFISALGILNYTKRVEDKEFEKLGLKMLEDVGNYF